MDATESNLGNKNGHNNASYEVSVRLTWYNIYHVPIL